MNIDHIEAFMYVVHFSSIHKAADALFLSQPTVTARIKTLERELNSELFVRQGRGIILTAKGKSFIPFAEQKHLCYGMIFFCLYMNMKIVSINLYFNSIH